MVKWKPVDPSHNEQLQLELLDEAKVDFPYLVLIVSSCAIATLGLLSNSAAVIIGAMIIAPLMLPIRSLAFGALVGNSVLFGTGIISVALGTLLAILISWLLGTVAGIASFGSEILARTQPTLLDLGIAIVAGGIGGYGKIEPKVSNTIAGIAIAVALMPPICTIGLGLSQANWELSQGATILYLTNLLGIALACMVVFLLAGYAPLRRARKALIGAIALTSVLIVPLGLRFVKLVENARLEISLRKVLLDRTITFQQLDLADLQVNWVSDPPQVRLKVYAKQPVTINQVELLEAFVAQELGRPFKLIFIVSNVEEVRRGQNPAP
jgi:uncharacterized hydrophobic protein (TIGR00271 family)